MKNLESFIYLEWKKFCHFFTIIIFCWWYLFNTLLYFCWPVFQYRHLPQGIHYYLHMQNYFIVNDILYSIWHWYYFILPFLFLWLPFFLESQFCPNFFCSSFAGLGKFISQFVTIIRWKFSLMQGMRKALDKSVCVFSNWTLVIDLKLKVAHNFDLHLLSLSCYHLFKLTAHSILPFIFIAFLELFSLVSEECWGNCFVFHSPSSSINPSSVEYLMRCGTQW